MDEYIVGALRSTFGINIKHPSKPILCGDMDGRDAFLAVTNPIDDKLMPEEIVSYLTVYGIKAKLIDVKKKREKVESHDQDNWLRRWFLLRSG